MYLRRLPWIIGVSGILPRFGRIAALVSSVVFASLGVIHLLDPLDIGFSTFLFFNFVAFLPMMLVFSALLFAVNVFRKWQAGTWSYSDFKKDFFLNMFFGLPVTLYVGVGFFLYFFLSLRLLGIWYSILNVIYIVAPLYSVNLKKASRYILTMLTLFLAATFLAWALLLGNEFSPFLSLEEKMTHMRLLPDLGNPPMVFVQMCMLFTVTNAYAALEIMYGSRPRRRRKVRG